MNQSQSFGCWTCRLRRKKCDKTRPKCLCCQNLNITCHAGARKPDWLISEKQKKLMLKKIKEAIKLSSQIRRESQRTRLFKAQSLDDFTSAQHVVSPQAEVFSSEAEVVPARRTFLTPRTFSVEASNGHSQSSASLDLDNSSADSALERQCHQNSNFDRDFLIKYLDHVFPLLFPFYRPAIFETGRGWILSLFEQSIIARHSILSLTSYVFTFALNSAYGGGYLDCVDHMWMRLGDQADQCFDGVRATVLDMTAVSGKSQTVLERVQAMESILQLLVFELIVGNAKDWNMHLNAAIALFDGLLQKPSIQGETLVSVLFSIESPTWYKTDDNTYVWTPDQAGFRFFAAYLVYVDVVASTALRRAPRLTSYYLDLLDEDNGAPVLGFTRLRLSSLMGCQNAVLVAIGQTAALDVSKKSEPTARIVSRASQIFADLDVIHENLQVHILETTSQNTDGLSFKSYSARVAIRSPSAITTMIWLHAARIYLCTVLGTDHNSSNQGINQLAVSILKLMPKIHANQLRTLAWPLCIAGCFAAREHSESFRQLFAEKTELELIGSPKEALRIIEEVWKERHETAELYADVASCLNILGGPSLLI